MIYVYHLKPTAENHDVALSFGDEKSRVRLAAGMLEYGDNYELVATVDGTDLEHAYMLTNNLDTSWSLEPVPGVTVIAKRVIGGKPWGLRSSMVGDVFQVDGPCFVVGSVGFHRLPLAG